MIIPKCKIIHTSRYKLKKGLQFYIFSSPNKLKYKFSCSKVRCLGPPARALSTNPTKGPCVNLDPTRELAWVLALHTGCFSLHAGSSWKLTAPPTISMIRQDLLYFACIWVYKTRKNLTLCRGGGCYVIFIFQTGGGGYVNVVNTFSSQIWTFSRPTLPRKQGLK